VIYLKVLLSGNEAIARGAYEAGTSVVSGYPGTPSTEIIESAARYPEIYSEWAPNEKVALEVAIGASLGGARAMACMKHVGLNVAADPLLTVSYMGIKGGLVIVSADDPGMWSSQNEQDNRHYARFAKVPLFEPSDSQEAKDFVIEAFRVSERFRTPVILRTTTRLSHTRTPVEEGERTEYSLPPDIVLEPSETVMVPAHARLRHPLVEQRLAALEEFGVTFDLNRIEPGTGDKGFITSGVAYQYVKEAFPDSPVLKLGMVWPVPRELVRRFAETVNELWVVEELDPILEEYVRAMGLRVRGKDLLPVVGEYSVSLLREAILGEKRTAFMPDPGLPPRGPVLCAGCPHRGVFYHLSRMKATVMGDIGCYTLGVAPPLSAIHSCTCMGAGISHAHGLAKAFGEEKSSSVVAVIGDSTFYHSGITGLLNISYNRSASKVIILDNSTTAMTGHQHHPGTGSTAMGEPSEAVDLERLVFSLGIKWIRTVDPYDLEQTGVALKALMQADEPAVVIARRECALLKHARRNPPFHVDQDLCRECGLCFRLGCPAIIKDGSKAKINPVLCNGCSMCEQVCKFGAIGGAASGAKS